MRHRRSHARTVRCKRSIADRLASAEEDVNSIRAVIDDSRESGHTGTVDLIEPGEVLLDQRQFELIAPRGGRKLHGNVEPNRTAGSHGLREAVAQPFPSDRGTDLIEPPVGNVKRSPGEGR